MGKNLKDYYLYKGSVTVAVNSNTRQLTEHAWQTWILLDQLGNKKNEPSLSSGVVSQIICLVIADHV
jgi:hypothetical protein